MAIYYVRSGATGSNNGTNWTNAYTAFASAVTAASTNGDLIYVAHDHAEDLAAAQTYTFAANVSALCVNTGTGALATGARIGHTTTHYAITLAGAFTVFIYGIRWQIAGTLGRDLIVASTTGAHFHMEACDFWFTNTGASRLIIGVSQLSGRSFVSFKDCGYRFGATTQSISVRNAVIIDGGSIDSSASAPATLFLSNGDGGVCKVTGLDLSHITDTLVGNASSGSLALEMYFCRLGSGVVPLAAQTSSPNKCASSVTLVDCAAGDQHYHLAHYDPFGSTVVDTGIYANDGAQYDGTNRYSLKISTTANASYWTPYVSPWITKYHSATASITPYLEILRDGSTTAYQDDEVWAEFTAKTTTGTVLSTFYSDRMTPLGTPANQAAGVGTSGWTGENASAWSGKCDSGSAFTPTEIGDIMARLVVGEPSITVYVDPTIRGV